MRGMVKQAILPDATIFVSANAAASALLSVGTSSENAALAGLLAGGSSMEVSANAASAATATAAAPRCRFVHVVRRMINEYNEQMNK